MEATFVGQPFDDEQNLYDFLKEVSANHALVDVRIVVAWAKRSGLARVAHHLAAIRSRDGVSQIIVGIDEGGATFQGLELAIELFDEAFVFHDRSRRTFHPKIYLVKGADYARLLIGSSNLTAGGVFFNYEASVDLALDLSRAPDLAFLDSVESYIDRLLNEHDACLPLDASLLEELLANPKIHIRDEDESRSSKDGPEDTDQAPHDDEEDSGTSPFGKPQATKRKDPRPQPRTRRASPSPAKAAPTRSATVTPAAAAGAAGRPKRAAATVEKRWWKRMTASDVLRKPSSSHQRNYVALSQAGHAIDRDSWFREELFGTATWHDEVMRSGNIKEVALIPFEVAIDGKVIGVYTIRVDHAEVRIADQNNSPTYLNWSSIIDIIRQRDFRGWWLELSRMSDGTFRLSLQRQQP